MFKASLVWLKVRTYPVVAVCLATSPVSPLVVGVSSVDKVCGGCDPQRTRSASVCTWTFALSLDRRLSQDILRTALLSDGKEKNHQVVVAQAVFSSLMHCVAE